MDKKRGRIDVPLHLMQYNRVVVKIGHTSQGSTSTLVRLSGTSGFFKKQTEREMYLPERTRSQAWLKHQ